jgi:hypothetical protein
VYPRRVRVGLSSASGALLLCALLPIAASCSSFSTSAAVDVVDASSDAPSGAPDASSDAPPATVDASVDAGPCPGFRFCSRFDGAEVDSEWDGLTVKPADDRATALALFANGAYSPPRSLRLTVKAESSVYDHESYVKKTFDVGTHATFSVTASVRVTQANAAMSSGAIALFGLSWGTAAGLQSLAYFELRGRALVPRVEDGNLPGHTDYSGPAQELTGSNWRKLRVDLAFTSATEAAATYFVGNSQLARETFTATQLPTGHVEVHVGSMGAFGSFTDTIVDYDDVTFDDH